MAEKLKELLDNVAKVSKKKELIINCMMTKGNSLRMWAKN